MQGDTAPPHDSEPPPSQTRLQPLQDLSFRPLLSHSTWQACTVPVHRPFLPHSCTREKPPAKHFPHTHHRQQSFCRPPLRPSSLPRHIPPHPAQRTWQARRSPVHRFVPFPYRLHSSAPEHARDPGRLPFCTTQTPPDHPASHRNLFHSISPVRIVHLHGPAGQIGNTSRRLCLYPVLHHSLLYSSFQGCTGHTHGPSVQPFHTIRPPVLHPPAYPAQACSRPPAHTGHLHCLPVLTHGDCLYETLHLCDRCLCFPYCFLLLNFLKAYHRLHPYNLHLHRLSQVFPHCIPHFNSYVP